MIPFEIGDRTFVTTTKMSRPYLVFQELQLTFLNVRGIIDPVASHLSGRLGVYAGQVEHM